MPITSTSEQVRNSRAHPRRKVPLSKHEDTGRKIRKLYETDNGRLYVGKIEDALTRRPLAQLQGQVDLIFTSPPFPLVRKKEYGNRTGEEYVNWLSTIAPQLTKLLSPKGSIVVEIGNAWEKGAPVMSTLPLEALIAFKKAAKLKLCQHIICHNPARLPSPVQWVNVLRTRLKDSYTHVWWMSPVDNPKANNRNVLLPYSADMKKLLQSKQYNSGKRPSGHVISKKGFLTDHGGSIAPNVIDLTADQTRIPNALLRFSGTGWDRKYRQYCADNKLAVHPARMQLELAAFMIQFLTNEGDLVLDPFAGSNTTGVAADALRRCWIAVEADAEYAEGSKGRFEMLRSHD